MTIYRGAGMPSPVRWTLTLSPWVHVGPTGEENTPAKANVLSTIHRHMRIGREGSLG